jgi:hypothetical protein
MNSAPRLRAKNQERARQSQDEQDNRGNTQSEQQRLPYASWAQLEARRLAQKLKRREIQLPPTPPRQQMNRYRQCNREKAKESQWSKKRHRDKSSLINRIQFATMIG